MKFLKFIVFLVLTIAMFDHAFEAGDRVSRVCTLILGVSCLLGLVKQPTQSLNRSQLQNRTD